MPLDLPGLYFDVERNRYFPISSKPAQALTRVSDTVTRGGEEARVKIAQERTTHVKRNLNHSLGYSERYDLLQCALFVKINGQRCN